MKIDKPGMYPNMSELDYRSDPCPAPSLTQSLAKIILAKSPLHAWHASPALNPDYRHDDDRKFDIGNIAHRLLLGRGKDIIVLEFENWMTKAAKEAREVAASAGKLAVLSKHYSKAEAMVRAAHEQLQNRGLGDLFEDGHGLSEVVTAWQENGIWMRQMIDRVTTDLRTFADFKSTELSAAPHQLSRMMTNAGWPIQAAMGERGLDVLDEKTQGRRRYLFVVQEVEKPYALTVAEIGEAALTMGRKQLDMAVSMWRHCIETNRWPGYPEEVAHPEYPGWFETQWLDREITHDEHRKREPMLTDLSGG
jgi:PDDEXK-like domain of unknown function (DUF3799)